MHPNANGEVGIAAEFADALAGRFRLGRLCPKAISALPTGPLSHPRVTASPSLTAGPVLLFWTLAPGADSYDVYVEDLTRHQTTFAKLSAPLTPGRSSGTIVGALNSPDTYDVELQACKGPDCGAFSNVSSVAVS